MANLAARFRESLDMMCECPDPQEKTLALELKGYISQYDSSEITESTLEELLTAMDSRLPDGMIKTMVYNILNTPIEETGLSAPPTKPSVWVE